MLEIRTFGTLDLRDPATGDDLGARLSSPKRTALLVYLATARPRGFRQRDELVEIFWPDLPERNARRALNQSIYVLRSTIGDAAIVNRGGGEVGLDPSLVWCDATAFDMAVSGSARREALELYGGEFLKAFHLSGSRSFERWLDTQREHYRTRAIDAATGLAAEERDRGNVFEAVRYCRAALEWAPYDERLLRQLLRLLVDRGDAVGAARELERFAERLGSDLGLEVSPETRTLLEKATPKRPAERPDVPAERDPPPADAPVPASRGAARRGLLDRASTRLPGRVARASEARRRDESHGPGAGRSRPAMGGLGWAALAALGLALGIGLVPMLQSSDDPPVDPDRLAIFPFIVHGDGPYAYLEQGLVDLLSIKLALPDRTRTLDPVAVLSRAGRDGSLSDVQSLARIAGGLGAGAFVHGSIVQSGGEAQIIASLYSTDEAKPRVVVNATLSNEARLFDAVDRLSRDLLNGWLIQDHTFSSLAGLTTTSLPAFKAYLAGERALREGRYRESVRRFEEATNLDPGFALAHYRVSVAANWAGMGDLVGSAAEEAWSLREGLPERARRLLRARHLSYMPIRDLTESIRLLREIIADYPDDVEARYEFADLRFHNAWLWGLGDAEVRTDFERVLGYDPEHSGALTHLFRIVARQRDARAVDSLLERGLSFAADGRSRHELETLAAFTRRDRQAQDRVLRRLRNLDDESLLRITAVTVTFSENFADAGRLIDLLRHADRDSHVREFGHAWSACLYAARGRLETARSQLATPELDTDLAAAVALLIELATPIPGNAEPLERARDRVAALQTSAADRSGTREPLREYFTDDFILLLLNLANARLGDTAAALRFAEDFEQRAEFASSPVTATLVKAAASLWSGDPEGALRLLDDNCQQCLAGALAHWHRFLRTEALRAAGDYEQALLGYEALPTDYVFGPLFTAASHLRRAQLYRRMERRAESEEHFRRTAELWKDADPAFHALLRKARTLDGDR